MWDIKLVERIKVMDVGSGVDVCIDDKVMGHIKRVGSVLYESFTADFDSLGMGNFIDSLLLLQSDITKRRLRNG